MCSFKIKEDKNRFFEGEKDSYEITRKVQIKASDGAWVSTREGKVGESAKERACMKEKAGIFSNIEEDENRMC